MWLQLIFIALSLQQALVKEINPADRTLNSSNLQWKKAKTNLRKSHKSENSYLSEFTIHRFRRSNELSSTIEAGYKQWDENLTCLNFGTCDYARGKSQWFCHCDTDCAIFKDCCYDYEAIVSPTQNEYNYSCYPFKTLQTVGYGFYSINDCQMTFKDSYVISKCKEDSFDADLFVVHNKTLVFKNKHCAYCNNIMEFEYFDRVVNRRLFSIKNFSFLLEEDKINVLRQYYHSYTRIPPYDTEIRTCVTGLTSNNNSLCGAYIRPIREDIVGTYKTYILKNIHCISSDITEKKLSCLSEEKLRNWERDDTRFLMSIMFSLKKVYSKEKCDIWTKEVSIAFNTRLFYFSSCFNQ